MKYLFVFLATLACASGASRRIRGIVSDVPDAIRNVLDKAVTTSEETNRTITNYCPTFHESIDAKVNEAFVCLDRLTIDENETVCDALETKIPACFDGAIEFFEGCLKNEGKTIPRLVRDILKSFTRFVCESSGEQLLELANPCIYKESEESNKLTEDVKEELRKYESADTLPSKQYICKELLEARLEALASIRSTCTLDVTKNSVTRFADAVTAPCQENSANEV